MTYFKILILGWILIANKVLRTMMNPIFNILRYLLFARTMKSARKKMRVPAAICEPKTPALNIGFEEKRI